MSVQAGIWNLDGKPINLEQLAGMSVSLKDYGPDGEGTAFDGPIGMLYRAFRTTVESRSERQPHVSACGNLFTWDGRLDNREELILDLGHTVGKDNSDVTIVAAAIDRWGTDCFAKLVGDWALAIWNSLEKRLILSRDYLGVRHLFYHHKATSIVWCSHLAPLALSGDQFNLSDEYVAGYLALWPEAHLTPYQEILAVPPGHFVCLHAGKRSVHRYWEFRPEVKIRYNDDREYEQHFRYLFRQAVRRRLRSDLPVLAELSGGLDSSSIVCMADDLFKKEGPRVAAIDTFSFCDSSEPDEDDSQYFTKVTERRHRAGHRVELHSEGNTFSLEYPIFVPVPGLGLRQELKAVQSAVLKRGNYRIVLSGTGGDEMLGQALDPRIQIADKILRFRVVALTKQLADWSLLLRQPWVHLLIHALVLTLPRSVRASVCSGGHAEPWMNPLFARTHRWETRQLDAAEGAWYWLPSIRDSFQTVMTLRRQMAHTHPSTHQTFYPFLDQTLVEFLSAIPTEQLLRPGHRRSLMRRALADLLPAEILSRRTKSGPGRCYAITLQNHWSTVEQVLRSPLISRMGYVNEGNFRASIAAVKNGQFPHNLLRLLRALSLEVWLKDVVSRGVISADTSTRSTQCVDSCSHQLASTVNSMAPSSRIDSADAGLETVDRSL